MFLPVFNRAGFLLVWWHRNGKYRIRQRMIPTWFQLGFKLFLGVFRLGSEYMYYLIYVINEWVFLLINTDSVPMLYLFGHHYKK